MRFPSYAGYTTESNKRTNKTHRHTQQNGGHQRGRGAGQTKRVEGSNTWWRSGLDFGWRAHSAGYRCRVLEVHMWILHNLINQCHPNRFNKKNRVNFMPGSFPPKKVPISKANRSRSSCKASACQVGICLETANYQHLCSAWKPFLQKTGSNFTLSQIVKQALRLGGHSGQRFTSKWHFG